MIRGNRNIMRDGIQNRQAPLSVTMISPHLTVLAMAEMRQDHRRKTIHS
jgi:hypothetical protein